MGGFIMRPQKTQGKAIPKPLPIEIKLNKHYQK
jgi:hypothetical protein